MLDDAFENAIRRKVLQDKSLPSKPPCVCLVSSFPLFLSLEREREREREIASERERDAFRMLLGKVCAANL